MHTCVWPKYTYTYIKLYIHTCIGTCRPTYAYINDGYRHVCGTTSPHITKQMCKMKLTFDDSVLERHFGEQLSWTAALNPRHFKVQTITQIHLRYNIISELKHKKLLNYKRKFNEYSKRVYIMTLAQQCLYLAECRPYTVYTAKSQCLAQWFIMRVRLFE